MRKILSLLLPILCFALNAEAEYVDHRGHNVDSLETVMAGLTAQDIENADDAQLKHIISDLDELMLGFNQTNGVKSEYYARMALRIAQRKGWQHSIEGAAKGIGQHFWAKEQYDSAAYYYSMAMEAVTAMSMKNKDGSSEKVYTQEDIDDALSQMYGTLGNLYSMMDSIDVAMDYYGKAGVIFKKHNWYNSCSILYYNMGETMREEGNLKESKDYYQESLRFSRLAGDSLAIATAYKGLGSLYMEMHKTNKAMRYLDDANKYFADHELEELRYRMESLDYTGQVLALQNRRRTTIIFLLIALLLLMAGFYLVLGRLRRTTREKTELEDVLEETVDAISKTPEPRAVNLKPREREILDLIAKGYTNAEIAEALCLSPETIKWYKKKLFAMFDASNSAELVTIAKDGGIL